MKKRFLRRKWSVFSKLGRGRRNKQVWRRPKGRHAKMREGRRGYGAHPSVGYKSARAERGKIQGLIPVMINNIKDLSKVQQSEIAIISSKLGSLKKYDIAKKSVGMNLKFLNFEPQKFIGEFERNKAEKKTEGKKEVKEDKKEIKKEEKTEEKGDKK
jgi:large subunit ribosomal protein L32e